MTSLTGQTPAATYGDLLAVGTGPNQVGLTNILTLITDAYGNSSPLSLSTIAFNISRSGYTWSLDSTPVTAAAVDINSMCNPNPVALGTQAFIPPVGTTADRAGGVTNGMFRYNISLGIFEGYESGSWVQFATSGSAVFSVSGTANRITSTGGVNPIINIALNYVGQTSITTLGTIGTGTWQGTTIAPNYGGTGINNGASTLTLGGNLATSGAFVSTFTMTGATNVTFPTTGTLATTATANVISVSGTANRITVSPTTGNTIVDISAAYVGQTSITTLGTIATGVWQGTVVSPTYGGSGVSNPTVHGVLIAEGSSAFTPIVLGAGQILIGTTSLDPVAAAIGSGSGILVGNSSGAITVSNTGVLSNIATANQTTVSGATGNVTIGIASNAILPGTGGVTLPTGNTAARAGGAGTIRFNSQTSVFEGTIDGATWATIPTAASVVASVSGTANRITSTGGTTPVIDISAAYVGQSSITTLGTIGTGIWQGTVIGPTYGGTGVNNGSSTITIGGNHTLSGAFASTFTLTNTTNVTFPTSGTLSTTTGTVTSITAGTNLTGGVITSTGTIALSATPSGLTSIGVGNLTISGVTIASSASISLTPNSVAAGINLGGNTFTTSGSILGGYEATNTFNYSFSPSALASNTNYTMPPALPGGNGYTISATTAGVLTWVLPAAGTVTSIGISSSTGLTIGSTPVTSSGTITVDIPSSITGNNMIVNGNFQVWQRGAGGSATYTAIAGGTTLYTADRWQFQVAGGGGSGFCNQVAGPTSGSFYAQVGRTAANAVTGAIQIGTSLTRDMCIGAAGNKITVTFKALKGANYSATSNLLGVQIYSGTGTSDVSIFSGFTGSNLEINQSATLTGTEQSFTYTSSTLGSTVTQLAILFVMSPTGTAGANDWFEVTNVKVEIGANSTAFPQLNFQQILAQCQRFYWKTYDYAVVPATVTTAGYHYYAAAAVTGQVAAPVNFPVEMRATPTIVTYAPSDGSSAKIDAAGAPVASFSTGVGVSSVVIGSNAAVAATSFAFHITADIDVV